MNTRAVLPVLATLLFAAAIPSLAGDSAQSVSAAAEGSACSRFKCMKECQRQKRGSLDECRAACSDLKGDKPVPRMDPICLENCQRSGQSREACEKYCTYNDPHAPERPATPSLPNPPQPQPQPRE
jgi:hypothetical protein